MSLKTTSSLSPGILTRPGDAATIANSVIQVVSGLRRNVFGERKPNNLAIKRYKAIICILLGLAYPSVLVSTPPTCHVGGECNSWSD